MSLEKMIPHGYQQEAIETVLRDKRTLVKAGVGAGKTLIGVEAALQSKAKVVLVIAPINTFTGWKKTFARQSGGEAVLRFIDARKAGRAAHEDLALGVPGYYMVGTERMRGQSWKGWDIDFAIHDECHRASNRKSQTFKMLSTITSEYALELSATPYSNKVEGAWAIARWLWPSHIHKSFWVWATEFLIEERDEYTYKKFGGEKSPGTIWKTFPSALQLPSVYTAQPAIHEVEVDLNPTQRKHYKELERDAITFLDENPLIVELPSVKYMRLLEMTLATPSIKQDWVRRKNEDTDEWERVWDDVVYFEDDAKSSKADAMLDLLTDLHAEKPEPVLVFTHSRKFATFLTKRLQSKGYEARQFVGAMSPDERAWKLENFGKEFSIMVATIQAIAEGTDGIQDVCATEVWMSVTDNKILNTQGMGRVNRQGQKRKVNRFVVRSRDTVETTVQHPRLLVDQAVLDSSYMEEIAA